MDHNQNLITSIIAIILAIAGIYAFYEIYPYGHLVTVILGMVVVAGTIYLNISKRIIFPMMVFVGGMIAFWFIGANLPPETKEHGWLLPSNETMPDIKCNTGGSLLNLSGTKGLIFHLGSNIALFDAMTFRSVLIQLDKTPLIAVERYNDKLIFDIDVYDENSEIVAKIDRGEFNLNSNKIFYAKRSDDRSSITVYDNKDNPVLDIKYHNQHYVTITGVFFSEDGAKAIIDDQKIFVSKQNLTASIGKICFLNSGFILNGGAFTFPSPTPVLPR